MTSEQYTGESITENVPRETSNQREPWYNWSRMSIEEMIDVYWQDIAPKGLHEGFDPECR